MADSLTIKAPFVGNDGRPLIEPGAFFLDGNYSLRVNSWNSLAGVTLTIRARMIRASDGELVDSSWDHVPNTNRTKATNDFPLPMGFILNVTVFASVGTPLIGQTFVQVQLARGLTGATLLQATMLQDYVTSVQALAYPGSPIRASTEGDGYPRTVTGSVPAAGADISELVPTGARWRIGALYAFLSASAAVSNRIPALRLRSGALVLGYSTATVAQTASQVVNYTWGENLPVGVSAAGTLQRTLPTPQALEVLGGMEIATLSSGLDAGDQWTALQMTVHERLEAA